MINDNAARSALEEDMLDSVVCRLTEVWRLIFFRTINLNKFPAKVKLKDKSGVLLESTDGCHGIFWVEVRKFRRNRELLKIPEDTPA